MKDLKFLTNCLFVNNGIYDNRRVYENTLESIKEAIDFNLGLFLNVCSTLDNKLIVFSGDNLSKIVNLKDRVSETTYEEIQFLVNYHVPLLSEVLEYIRGRVPIILCLNINKKNKELIDILGTYKYELAITSMSNNILNWVSSNIHNIIIGEMIDNKILNVKDFFGKFSFKSDFKLLDINKFDPITVKKYKFNNNIVIGYLINNNEKYQSFKDTFDNLIIDNYKNIDL